MKHRLALPLHLAAAGLLFAAPALDDAIAFAPAAGTTLLKTFNSSFELDLDDLMLEVDGEDVMAMVGVPEMRMRVDATAEVEDEYLELADGRPKKLERSFEALEMRAKMNFSMAGESRSEDDVTSSDLQGQAVVFSWDEGRGEYRVAWAEGSSGSQELLDGLEEDMDLRAVLPVGPVAEGSTWTLPIEALGDLVAPGGNLGTGGSSSEQEFDEFMELLLENFGADRIGDLFSGMHQVTYAGKRQVGDRQLGVLAIEIDLTATVDFAGMLDPLLARIDAPVPVEFDIRTAQARIDMRGQGEVLWDLAAGHVADSRMDLDLLIDLELEASVHAMDERTDISAAVNLSGRLRSQLEVAGR